MGQAKLRGTFEQRQTEGVERLALIAEAKEAKRLAREAELRQWALDNPKQARIHKSKRMLLASMVALASIPTTANYTNNEEGLNDKL